MTAKWDVLTRGTRKRLPNDKCGTNTNSTSLVDTDPVWNCIRKYIILGSDPQFMIFSLLFKLCLRLTLQFICARCLLRSLTFYLITEESSN